MTRSILRRPPCPSDVAELAAMIADRDGCDPDDAELRALAEHGLTSWHHLATAHAARIEREIGRLPPPCDAAGSRLLAGTRRLLASAAWVQCIARGWSLEDVFGLDGWSPFERRELLGLVPAAAVAPKVGRKLLAIDAAGAEFQDPAGCLTRFRRPSLVAADAGDAVLWWASEALVNAEVAA